MSLLDNLEETLLISGKRLLALALLISVVLYILPRRKTIYDQFPRVSDNILRSIFWPTHVQKLVWKGYQDVSTP